MFQSTMYSTREVIDVNYHPVLHSNRYHHYAVDTAADGLKALKIKQKKMPDEKIISSNTSTDTKTVENADGTKTTTITTTIVDKYADGRTSTKTKVQTITEGIKPAGADGKNVTTFKGDDDIKAHQKSAKRVKVSSSKEFLKDALKAHNNYRDKHGVKDLSLDDDLCAVAQAWANELAEKDKMEHSNNGYGENVFWTSTAAVSGPLPVDSWYKEIKDFNFKKVDHQPGTGHFTQVVWKDSKKLGIAYAQAKNGGGTYVVANYEPAGNFLGQYPENVMPLKKFRLF
ncbi:unnamed protein product [Allacma fusca]|uniref:SCP domain-containing protein n=1 Tax=Allacma fusca TaxID=39272 RepID=A0A8J2P8P3_9HEXA|nr:unnamed protein product [Allacma fusca]